MMMAIWKLALHWRAGNTVVLGLSDTTPASSIWLAEKLADILPAGVVNVVCGDRATGATLTAHPIPRMVSITGSTRAGMAVATAAASDLKVTHLELSGGKAPVVVFDDVDLGPRSKASRWPGCSTPARTAPPRPGCCARRACTTSSSPSWRRRPRRPAPASIRPTRTSSTGRSTIPRQLSHVSGLVERAPSHARVVTGGRQVDRDGYFYEPTVVADLQQDDELIRTEIFGPVLTVQKFGDEDEAVALANDTVYGLASSVDVEHRDGGPAGDAARLRLRVGQHPYSGWSPRMPARRLQALRARQGPRRCTALRTTPGSST